MTDIKKMQEVETWEDTKAAIDAELSAKQLQSNIVNQTESEEIEALQNQLKNERTSFQNRLENSSKEFKNLKVQLEKAYQDIETQKNSKESFGIELENSNKELEGLREQLEKAYQDIETQKSTNELFGIQLENSNAELESLKIQLQNANKKISAQKEEIDTITRERDDFEELTLEIGKVNIETLVKLTNKIYKDDLRDGALNLMKQKCSSDLENCIGGDIIEIKDIDSDTESLCCKYEDFSANILGVDENGKINISEFLLH